MSQQHKGEDRQELKRIFRPEFLNRVAAVVVFKSLTTHQIRQIDDLQLQRLGKRPLRRVITSRIADQLCDELFRGRISRGDLVVVDVSPADGFTFHAERT